MGKSAYLCFLGLILNLNRKAGPVPAALPVMFREAMQAGVLDQGLLLVIDPDRPAAVIGQVDSVEKEVVAQDDRLVVKEEAVDLIETVVAVVDLTANYLH